MALKLLRLSCLLMFIVLVALATHVWNTLTRPMVEAGVVETLTIGKGQSFEQITDDLFEKGLITGQPYARLAAKLLQVETQIKAGDYSLAGPLNTLDILRELMKGGGILYKQTLFEGWTIREMLESMRANPTIENTENPLMRFDYSSPEEAEGRCLPETYNHHRGAADHIILGLCLRGMRDVLAELWEQRVPELPYRDSKEALILASIVEAETKLDAERPKVAGVLVARLRKGMRLQADPTVIYGLGSDFDNNLTRAHLRQGPDINRYNTYRIDGLPPGPICNPGRESIQAALNPDLRDGNLFYVAVGDGSHYFSKNYKDHEKAVRKYQLGEE